MNETQEKCYEMLCKLNGEHVINLVTDWYGAVILDDRFLEFLEDELGE